jgi:hypothetical protein
VHLRFLFSSKEADMSAKQKYRSVEIDTNKIGKDAAGDGYYYVRVLQSKTRDARDARTQPLRIAPCGINCALCSGYQRTVNTCPGCLSDEPGPSYCRECSIKLCEKKTSPADLCINCEDYPCRRMKQLEKRYRENTGRLFLNRCRPLKKRVWILLFKKNRKNGHAGADHYSAFTKRCVCSAVKKILTLLEQRKRQIKRLFLYAVSNNQSNFIILMFNFIEQRDIFLFVFITEGCE